MIIPLVCTILVTRGGCEEVRFANNFYFGEFLTLWMQKTGISRVVYCMHFFFLFSSSSVRDLMTAFSLYTFHACSQALADCGKTLLRNTNTSDEIFPIYLSILETKELVENILGVPLFLLTLLGFLNSFTALSNFMGFNIGKLWSIPPFSHTVIVFSLNHFLNWIVLLVSAAEVNEQDIIFRTIVTNNSLQRLNYTQKHPLDYVVSIKPPIAISVCGSFSFTRPLIVTAVGAMFTYSVLIM
ncbi:hypothetical protein NPIL_605471 [Nephila pilipes]|uniref:Gustatory receptor n=1 Tax=Nephila pilipes TaxID=299642 RepID=A0A8X6U4W8_NEPPI|nr:hypothetical protein NPIL_605471 [Nephila pilipes]